MDKALRAIAIAGALLMGVLSLVGRASGGDDEPADASPNAAYTVECTRLIAGGERYVRLSNEQVVSWECVTRNDPLDGDGMSDGLESYTFTGISPGVVDVQIVNVLPWADDEGIEDMFRLVVDDDLQVEREEISLVESFKLRQYGTTAECRVLSAEPGDAGFLLVSSYTEGSNGHRSGNRSLLVLPNEVTAAFVNCGVFGWNGFDGADSDVLDGESFSFVATLDNGTTIEASGTNSFPEGYADFERSIGDMLGLN